MTARTIYIRWSDDGQSIRKWDWSEFDLAERLIAESVTVSDPNAQALADALRDALHALTLITERDGLLDDEMVLEAKAISALAAWEAKP